MENGHEILSLKNEMSKLNVKVDKVIDILSGNELDRNDSGLVGDVRQLKARVARLERWKDKVIYILIGASFVAGWTIPDILAKIFLHK